MREKEKFFLNNLNKKILFLYFFIFIFTFKNLKSEVKEYFPNLGIKIESPAFEKSRLELTSVREMIKFLVEVEKKYSNVEYRRMELKNKEYGIPYLVITKEGKIEEELNKNKITVWIQAMQHGDEHGSGESALNLISYFIKDEENFLQNMNLIIIPRINIEGSEKNRSSVEEGIDLNRDHMMLSTDKAKALKKGLLLYDPEVVIDLHEYPASEKQFAKLPGKRISPYYDVLMATSNNKNAPLRVEDLDKAIFSKVVSNLESRGIRTHKYYSNLNKSEDMITLTAPIVSVEPARNAFALTPRFFILLEGRGKGIGMDFFERRINSLSETTKEFLQIFNQESKTIKKMIAMEKERVKNLKEDIVVLESGKEMKTDSYKFIALHEGVVKDYDVTLKTEEKETGGLVRKKPLAYIFPGDKKEILKILNNHGIEYRKISIRKKILAEEYHISQNKKHYNLIENESYGEVGDIFVELNQVQNRLIMLLFEPESDGSFVINSVVSYKKEVLPFKRVLSREEI